MHFHTWKIKKQETQESGYDQLRRGGHVRRVRGDTDVFRRDVIVTYECACGAEKVERV